ncbi:MAG: hypothetical protein NC413_10640 [Muribaculum sp.]|nr:hypothetical protein [Muribaculum sp.]
MEIIKSNIEQMMKELSYVDKDMYSDNQLNTLYNYLTFLEECEDKIMSTEKVSLETLAYSKYYWHSHFTYRFREVYGFDAGIEQQQDMALYELECRVENVDLEFVEGLYTLLNAHSE